MKDAETKEIILKDNAGRAAIAINVFWAICLLNLLALFSGYLEIEFLRNATNPYAVSDQEANLNDLRQGAIGLLQTIAYAVSIFVFLSWFRRAYGNLHRIKSDQLDNSEMMAIWGFVIPIVNLYKPYRIAKEIVYETHKELKKAVEDYPGTTSFAAIRLWWILFLISNFVGRYVLRSTFKADTTEQLIDASVGNFVSDFIDIFAAVATILMIRATAAKESLLYDRFNRRVDVH